MLHVSALARGFRTLVPFGCQSTPVHICALKVGRQKERPREGLEIRLEQSRGSVTNTNLLYKALIVLHFE